MLLDGSADIEVYPNILEFLFDESAGFNLCTLRLLMLRAAVRFIMRQGDDHTTRRLDHFKFAFSIWLVKVVNPNSILMIINQMGFSR